jgi:chromosome segregation ATPase
MLTNENDNNVPVSNEEVISSSQTITKRLRTKFVLHEKTHHASSKRMVDKRMVALHEMTSADLIVYCGQLETLLEEKERDLVLAARLGQSLIEAATENQEAKTMRIQKVNHRFRENCSLNVPHHELQSTIRALSADLFHAKEQLSASEQSLRSLESQCRLLRRENKEMQQRQQEMEREIYRKTEEVFELKKKFRLLVTKEERQESAMIITTPLMMDASTTTVRSNTAEKSTSCKDLPESKGMEMMKPQSVENDILNLPLKSSRDTLEQQSLEPLQTPTRLSTPWSCILILLCKWVGLLVLNGACYAFVIPLTLVRYLVGILLRLWLNRKK